MDKGRFVFTCFLSNLATSVEVIGTFDYLDFGVFIYKGDVCPSLLILGGIAHKLSFGIRIFPLRTYVVTEHKPAEKGAYKGGSYLNGVHKSNSTNTADSSGIGVFGKGFNLIRHDESVFKENTGEVKKLFSLFLGSLRPVDTFVSQRPYAVCPLSHGLGNHTLLNQLVYGINKPDILLSEHLLNGKLKGCSATGDDKVIVFLHSLKNFLGFYKSFIYLFWYSYVRERLWRDRDYVINDNTIKFFGIGTLLYISKSVCPSDTYNGSVTVRALSKNVYVNHSTGYLENAKDACSRRQYRNPNKNHTFKAVRANAFKTKQLRGYFTWN